MKEWESKLAPALVAVAVVVGVVVLALRDHAQIAAAFAVIGLVWQTFQPPALRKVPAQERITDPDPVVDHNSLPPGAL